ncbi:hypothetical protein LQZ19_05940 [Treponema primitia]|uniref:hypothetical protein n=1 Tax=Treponema primitia TaxID=88058 RepID=UPI00397F4CD8
MAQYAKTPGAMMDRMKIDTKVIDEIASLGGFNLDFLNKNNIPLTIFSELIAHYHFTIVESEAIKYLMDHYANVFDEDEKSTLLEVSRYFLNYYNNLENTKDNASLLKLAEIFVDSYENFYILQGKKFEPLVFNNFTSAKILDLCSGPDFINFIPSINDTNQYYCIDKSLFVRNVIQYQCKKYNSDNIKVIQDTNTNFLNHKICKDFNCIRAKNVFKYDNDFCSTVRIYFNRILSKGAMIFQETSCLNAFEYYIQMSGFIEMCRYFIYSGCNFEYTKGEKNNEISFDTLTFCKNNIPDTEIEWNRFSKFIRDRNNYTTS